LPPNKWFSTILSSHQYYVNSSLFSKSNHALFISMFLLWRQWLFVSIFALLFRVGNTKMFEGNDQLE
jgi:hypothetical protein